MYLYSNAHVLLTRYTHTLTRWGKHDTYLCIQTKMVSCSHAQKFMHMHECTDIYFNAQILSHSHSCISWHDHSQMYMLKCVCMNIYMHILIHSLTLAHLQFTHWNDRQISCHTYTHTLQCSHLPNLFTYISILPIRNMLTFTLAHIMLKH